MALELDVREIPFACPLCFCLMDCVDGTRRYECSNCGAWMDTLNAIRAVFPLDPPLCWN